jgi:2-oxoglutarate dehydrogenase complex dehydrogenase (E1) component-like enzyme
LDSASRENTFFLIVSLTPFSFVTPLNFPLGNTDTQIQLDNRVANSNLLRYVDAMRTHGHRAAHIDPLDLIHREEVAALSPERYGLADPEQRYNVNGILWTKRVGEVEEGSGEEWWTLSEIKDHLRKVYIGNIAYEVCGCLFFFRSIQL